MRLISAPRNLLISLASVCSAKILQTVRKLDARLRMVAQRAEFDFFRSARLQAGKFRQR